MCFISVIMEDLSILLVTVQTFVLAPKEYNKWLKISTCPSLFMQEQSN